MAAGTSRLSRATGVSHPFLDPGLVQHLLDLDIADAVKMLDGVGRLATDEAVHQVAPR